MLLAVNVLPAGFEEDCLCRSTTHVHKGESRSNNTSMKQREGQRGCYLSLSDLNESSTAGSANIRSPSSMSRARGSILRGSSREKGSISKPGTWDRALAISFDRPGGESPGEERREKSVPEQLYSRES